MKKSHSLLLTIFFFILAIKVGSDAVRDNNLKTETIVISGIYFAISAVFYLIYSYTKPTEESIREKNEKQKLKEILKVKHIEGLPLAEGIYCKLDLLEETLIINSDGIDFDIEMNRIIAMEIKTETEIQQTIKSSGASAIVGGIAFGVVGAIIGARPKTKEKKVNNFFLIVSYQKDEEIKYLMFEPVIPIDGYTFVSKFKKFKPTTEKMKVSL